ncbi:MAG: hypothetical protein IKM32_02775 [Clostridia bacterium]|nr:hypothetical protein [Clostridia bacterium]
MKKVITLLLLTAAVLLVGCWSKYDENDFLGKSSKEIVAEFGDFDFASRSADAEGVYRNAVCGYTVREKRTGLLDSKPEVLIFIHFDEDGIAVHCEEGYRPGG